MRKLIQLICRLLCIQVTVQQIVYFENVKQIFSGYLLLHNKLCQNVMALLFLTVSVGREFERGWAWVALAQGVSCCHSHVGLGWGHLKASSLTCLAPALGRREQQGLEQQGLPAPLLSLCGLSLQCGASGQPDSLPFEVPKVCVLEEAGRRHPFPPGPGSHAVSLPPHSIPGGGLKGLPRLTGGARRPIALLRQRASKDSQTCFKTTNKSYSPPQKPFRVDHHI